MCGISMDLSSKRLSFVQNHCRNGNVPIVPSPLTCLFPASSKRLNSNLYKGGVSEPGGRMWRP